uniref:Reverse transcriptase domain-containing protein n=1 Tax=Chromera velia CCMP2878 TaxID=1169474 RepID=A0A0G4I0Q6_9ALVE|eukprot:Cvel_9979.t1-p1 / transcript=Cvel_9979.t1 / gene=Cvel_9979 / organism=Chromera_velia_CCMP2878 / gene_product=Transposon Ty3-I Gag-Pol polyprotein, putative / transcript_product=Transposon Ty3-I Gag-Pol polyprotein, putative / location=Cvel_scaffold590:61588-64125(-) / protein_length=499 / sequence_SO=supercontig / SO=protein_coding / is_pseudo=false
MQNGYPFCRYYSTKTSRVPGKLIRFHGRLAGVPVRCLYNPGADSNFLAHSVAESNRFTLWDLDEPTACKGGLNGGPQLPISQEVKGLPLCIQGFSAPLDLTVLDLDDDYDVVLGMPFCKEYIPIPHYREKALTIPASESPTGRDLLLLESEEYPAEGKGEDFFSQRELRRLMKRPSSHVHLFCFEAVRKGRVSDMLGVYSLQFAGLPPHRKIECEIKLETGHSPPVRAPYRLSYGQLDELRRQLDSYLEKGHIRPSTSPYAAPVLFVQKADGTQRMCIDFTRLNKITVRDKFPIPHLEELLSRLHGAKFFSSLVLRQYFHQTRIREGNEEKTAFVTSRTPEEHIEYINQVLSLLREHQLYVKELGITPKYIPGRANIVADALSRNPPAARQLVPSPAEVSRMGRAQRLPVRPRPLPEAVLVSVQPVRSLGAEYADLPDLVPEIEESQTPVREGDGQQSRVRMELQSLTVSATQSQAFLDPCRRGYSADPFFHPVFQHLL